MSERFAVVTGRHPDRPHLFRVLDRTTGELYRGVWSDHRRVRGVASALNRQHMRLSTTKGATR